MRHGWFAVAWLLGLVAQQHQARLWSPLAYLCALLLGAMLWRWRWRVALPWLWGGLAALALAWGWSGWRATLKPAPSSVIADVQTLVVRGVISDWPKAVPGGARFRIDVQQRRDASGRWQHVEWPLKLSWYRMPESLQLHAGDQWQWAVRVKPVRGHRNPYGYDTELRDWSEGLAGVGYVKADEQTPQRLAQAQAGWVMRLRDGLRQRLLTAPLLERTRAWLSALILGDRSLLNADDWQVLQATGTAHLLSVSGLHITVWAGLAGWLLSALWGGGVRLLPSLALRVSRRQLSSSGALLLAFVYALLAGGALPVQRAWLMLLALVLLQRWAVLWPKGLTLAWIAVLVTVFDPWAVAQASFWLSFVAVAALLSVLDAQRTGWRARVAQLWRAQWRVGWILMPVSAWWLGQVSVLGFAVNLWAIPLVTVLILPLALLGVVWPAVWQAADLLLRATIGGLDRLVQVSGGVWWVSSPPAVWALLAVLGLWWAVRPGAWWTRGLGLAWVLPALLWRAPPPPAGVFEVWAFDVGQGSAVLVRTAQHNLLFDTGPSYWLGGDAAARLILPSLRRAGMVVDALVLSHQDHDHVGGSESIAQAFPEATLWASFATPDRPSTACSAGRHWQWDGVAFAFVHPKRVATGRANNADSCVLQVRAAGRGALLTGDMGVAEEQALLDTRQDWTTDLLIAAHHGSKTSSSEAWLRALSPQWIWVQAGFANRYHHPSAEVVTRWAELDLRWQQTADCGALRWRSDAPEQSVCERTLHPRYWGHAPN